MIIQLLQSIERYGNRLPHPTTLFIYLCFLIIAVSGLAYLMQWQALHPITGQVLSSKSLISQTGLHYILENTVKNFISFAPLGTVLIAMLGIGIAEKSGLLGACLKAAVLKSPSGMLSYLVVFSGVLSSIAADSGYVVLIPLSALLFSAAGRNPLLGIAAAFAGVSGGYSANLMIGPLDIILAGISSEAVKLVDTNAAVSPLANYYFIIASTFLVTIVGGLVTEKIICPLLKSKDANKHNDSALVSTPIPTPADTILSTAEKQGLQSAGICFLAIIIALVAMTLPENALLRNPETGSLIRSPFISGIVVLISLIFVLCAIAYSQSAKTLQEKNALITSMESTMATMAGYLVLMFFAAQFVNYFAWSNLGTIIAIKGATLLQHSQLSAISLLLGFILISAAINLFIGSASAKWALMAPIFIPMLALLDIDPAATQMAYRIGDSSTNIITPLMPYFALVLAFAEKHDKQFGVGNLLALMLPYSFAFLISWLLLLSVWLVIPLPFGPI